MFDMAIFKATYTKKAPCAKANIRYIEHRPGKDGAKITRTLWGIDGKMERAEAYQMIDEAKPGSVFYRLVINLDAEKEDTYRDIYVRELTEHTMLGVENRLGQHIQWVAATHDDHTPLRHVHILALLPQKLHVQDLQALRHIATEAAREQRHQRDAALEMKRQRAQGKERQWELHR